MNQTQFADYTKRILEALPSWFKMKHDPASIGAKFLNVVGLEMDDISALLDYAFEQTHLEEADISQLDVLYKTLIPINLDTSKIERVFSERQALSIVTTIEEFSKPFESMNDQNICFIDSDKNILYTRHPYDAFTDCPTGKISYEIAGVPYTQRLSLHHVWTFLDEFGLLLCCQRLTGESNRSYKKRLLDVFKHPAGANRSGLINALARELNLRAEVKWLNPEQPCELKAPMIVLNTIEVNQVPVKLSEIEVTQNGHVKIQPQGYAQTDDVTVSYVHGLEMHQLGNSSDMKLRQELLNVDSTATDLLKYYVERIHLEAPIMWNHFRWDESFWDTSSKETTGNAYIPSLFDASIDGFKAYQ